VKNGFDLCPCFSTVASDFTVEDAFAFLLKSWENKASRHSLKEAKLMLTLDDPGQDLFAGWIPEELLKLSEELEFADKVLSDARILEVFGKNAKTTGRPSTAIATYLRMMYLKRRYQMSYEATSLEVADSLKWRKFCHLPLNGKVPDDKTLIKLTAKYGEEVVKRIHDTVVQRAVEAKIIRGRKMRLDTTVTESNIHHPTDTGLLADGVRVVSRTIKKIKEVIRFKTRFRNRTRMMKRRLIGMFKFLRSRKAETREKFKAAKEEILGIAQAAWSEALKVLEEWRKGKVRVKAGASEMRVIGLQLELQHWLELLKRVMSQTRSVLDGNLHIPDRLVSLFDEGARPIQKGKAFPKTEFGRKVLIQEAEKGVVTDYQIHTGNPPDQPMLEPAVEKHEEIFGHVPKELAGDRGFYAPGQDDLLKEQDVQHVSIPVKGGKSPMRERTEKSAWFRRLQRWRSGGEGKISLLKRKFGLRRTAVRGDAATAKWIGWGCLVGNIVLLSKLSP
jgi:IS5 family transposase